MVRRDGAEVRKERIAEIGRFVHKGLSKSEELSLSKTVALLQYQFGLTKDKLQEYLTILEDLGHFALDNEKDRICKANEEG